ncbi:baseplate J/gp47 family protein [Campylobacter sp. faydin G-24]|uniref:Baseplate J/gp47 family protein n=1 Tax=Campylobacter anatolicus TaxID=2829105 RepID=A0ABS5HJ34_9BACT|nr:baseplate J/gp47 family protein [Campylobacter anatolicus]MBR8464271.1 baseplate J/gp47 family protein [Campylobacter anatolicus]
MKITNDKIIIDSLSDIKERLQSGFKQIYGNDITLSPNSPDAQMIGLFSQALGEVNECIAYIIQMLDPYLAHGEFLDQRVAYAGLIRKGAEYSNIDGVVLHGTAGVYIPKSTTFKDKNGETWISDYAVSLGDEGSASVSLKSKNTGAFSVKAGAEFELSEIILGLDRAVATQDSVLGADEESDAELLVRFMLSHSINNNDDRSGLKAALLNLKGVRQVEILENYTKATDENGVSPHSINVVILGGDDEEIAQTILRKKIGGCGLDGSTVVKTEYLGVKREVRFERVEQINPKIVLRIKKIDDDSQINTDKIKHALSDKNFNIGEDIYASRLYSDINLTQGFEILSLSIDGGAVKNIGVREMAVILLKDIDVSVE